MASKYRFAGPEPAFSSLWVICFRLMQKLAVLSLILLGAVVGTAQSEKKMPRKVHGTSKPECAQGSICFSGEIREGQTFRKDLNAGLEFVLGLPGGFQVEIKLLKPN